METDPPNQCIPKINFSGGSVSITVNKIVLNSSGPPDLLKSFVISRLKEILVFTKFEQKNIQFIGTSLLFILCHDRLDVKLIDFAKVRPATDTTTNNDWLNGLDNLISLTDEAAKCLT